MKLPVVFLALAIAFAILSGGTMHAVVPHDHGHSHEGDTVIWQELHAALRHSEKYILPTGTFMLVVFGLFLAVARLYSYPIDRLGSITARDPVRGALLRRGIISYRRFG